MHLFRLASTAFLLLREQRGGRLVRRSFLSSLSTASVSSTPLLASDNDSSNDPSDLTAQKYANLLDWLVETKNGEIHDAVELKPSTRGGGYGAFVTRNVPQDTVLFTVPRAACLTLENALNDPACGETFAKVMEKAGPGGKTVVMAGYMAKEWLKAMEDLDQGRDLAETSAFGPYLRTLPWERGVNSQEHILFWNEQEIETRLRGSMCYSEARALREEVALATKVTNGIVGPTVREYRGEYVDDGGFKWPWQQDPEEQQSGEYLDGLAAATKGSFVAILTRSFQDGDDDQEKLVPLLDMLQHSDEPNISHDTRGSSSNDNGDKAVVVKARRPLQAGEELLNQYRSERDESMPYHRFFTRFGFVPGIQEDISNLLLDKSSIFFAQKAEV